MSSNFFPVTEYPHLLHSVFEAVAITVGALYYRQQRGLTPLSTEDRGQWRVLLGCLLGAALGNKLVFWLEMPHLFAENWGNTALWVAGQSMVGGLLGALLGVELAKKAVGYTRSTGDAFVAPIILGLMIGRIGCFLAGLADGTYGIPSHVPWAVDFGDGIPRHPTQIYEILFLGFCAAGLRFMPRLTCGSPVAGLRFKLFLSAYLLWRLGIDAYKPIPFDYGQLLSLPYALSGIQLLCAVVLLWYLPITWRELHPCLRINRRK